MDCPAGIISDFYGTVQIKSERLSLRQPLLTDTGNGCIVAIYLGYLIISIPYNLETRKTALFCSEERSGEIAVSDGTV